VFFLNIKDYGKGFQQGFISFRAKFLFNSLLRSVATIFDLYKPKTYQQK